VALVTRKTQAEAGLQPRLKPLRRLKPALQKAELLCFDDEGWADAGGPVT